MEAVTSEKTYTAIEYLAFEESAKNKHEYFNGNILKMPGASFRHNQIAVNVMVALANSLSNKNFIILNSDMKIHIPQLESFVYPAAVVIFEKPEFYAAGNDVILNPLLIVEVASTATQKYDRYTIFQYYKTLPSFKEYIMVEQAKAWVVSSYKIADRTWQDTETRTLDSAVYLRSVDCTIDLKKIYNGVAFNTISPSPSA